MRLSALIVTMLALALSAASPAKKPKIVLPTPPTISATPIALMVAGFDRDGDARVSRAEYDAGVRQTFADGDANGDGRITLIELSNWSAKWLGNAGALPGQFDFDRDGDDAISAEEYRAEFERRFAGFDRDKDGMLVRAELVLLSQPRLDPRQGPPPGGKPGEAQKPPPK